jgi:hypothetical protein
MTKRDVEDIRKIRSKLDEINGVYQDAINLQLDGAIKVLKKYILEKQSKLENEITKFHDMTNDKIAGGLLDSITFKLQETGNMHAQALKIESQQTNSALEQMTLMITVTSMLSGIVEELQEIENLLNVDI